MIIQWRKSTYSQPDGSNCVEVGWRKSSYSNPEGECVEVGWRVSSYSANDGGNCVEVSLGVRPVLVQDSKRPEGGHLAVGRSCWRALVAEVKVGALDL
ncbi:DUF397 domain-containing protein [Actinocorallia longicatena]|uniref:DUF397 domain-containing protein n=1 Tax=Actinocorallia longicatena TaxID=111803 RepID=A0ABP6QPY1_9ACTN